MIYCVEVAKNDKKRPTSSTAGPSYPSQTAVTRLSRGAVLLNNSNAHYPVTDDLQNLSEDTTGFIYSTYSAAKREDHKNKILRVCFKT
jgi:hypothetical protein